MGAIGVGCQPNLGTPPSQVTSLRFLAVQETPAEANPGSTVSLRTLLVDGTGPRPDLSAGIDWAFCNEQKPLDELVDVSPACFGALAGASGADGGPALTEIGSGVSAMGALPSTACSLFGPDVPPTMMGMPAGRPADPDPTGGYYQPVRLVLQTDDPPGTAVTVLGTGECRIVCGLPGASSDTLAQFKMQYTPNQNPEITGVSAGGTMLAPDDGTSPGLSVPHGSPLALTASWPACPAAPMHGCGAESYVIYDQATQQVKPATEALTVSWFATAGSFAANDTGPDDAASGTTSTNTWTPPATATPAVFVWVVLRDDRGGVTWQGYRFAVS